MHLTPREQEKLLIYVASELARKRQARGLKLNYPETVTILTAEIMEAARDGKSVAEMMTWRTTLIGREEMMEGVADQPITGASIARVRPGQAALDDRRAAILQIGSVLEKIQAFAY